MFVDAGDDDAAVTDAGPTDASVIDDAGVTADAGGIDAGTMDAGSRDAGGADAGVSPIVIDGTIGGAEWAGATEAINTTATAWTGNELHRLLVTLRDGRLYLAVEGSVETTNAIVVYVDHGFGGAGGVAALSDLTDTSGALDNAVSVPASAPYTTPAGFRADFGWGTRAMGRSAVGFDAEMGWRDLASNPADFAWIDAGSAPTACSASACETFIPLTTLGGSAPRTIALFARIHNGFGDMSPNQTLPMDDPSMPRVVSTVLMLSE